MRAFGTKRLEGFRRQIWAEADPRTTSILPQLAYLPDDTIKALLDSFAALQTTDDIAAIVKGVPFLDNYHEQILLVISELRTSFIHLKAAEKLKKAEEKKAAGEVRIVQEQMGGDSDSEMESEDKSEEESDNDQADGGDEGILGPSGITWKINFRCVAVFSQQSIRYDSHCSSNVNITATNNGPSIHNENVPAAAQSDMPEVPVSDASSVRLCANNFTAY
jgi:hypothetical protein